MLSQHGLRMIELINVVTYAWPVETSACGCSETLALGTIQETFGSSQSDRSSSSTSPTTPRLQTGAPASSTTSSARTCRPGARSSGHTVRPVVGNLARVVITHHIDTFRARAFGAGTAVRFGAAAFAAFLSLSDKAVHVAPVEILRERAVAVRPAVVFVARIVKRRHAAAVDRVGLAHARGNPVRPRIRPEVGVEGAVLLHDHDDVLDLVDAFQRRRQHDRGGDRAQSDRHRRDCQCPAHSSPPSSLAITSRPWHTRSVL